MLVQVKPYFMLFNAYSFAISVQLIDCLND